MKQLHDAIGRPAAVESAQTPRDMEPDFGPAFAPAEEWTVENVHALPSADALGRLASTWSYVQLGEDPEAALALARDLAAEHAAQDGTVVIPQNCVSYRTVRLPASSGT